MPRPSNATSDRIQALYERAIEARKAGHTTTAQAAVDRLLEQAPGHAGGLYLRGLLSLDLNQFDDARSWVERAIEVHSHADFYATLCGIQLQAKEYAVAVQTARLGYRASTRVDHVAVL